MVCVNVDSLSFYVLLIYECYDQNLSVEFKYLLKVLVRLWHSVTPPSTRASWSGTRSCSGLPNGEASPYWWWHPEDTRNGRPGSSPTPSWTWASRAWLEAEPHRARGLLCARPTWRAALGLQAPLPCVYEELLSAHVLLALFELLLFCTTKPCSDILFEGHQS